MVLGRISLSGSDGTNFVCGAFISGAADGQTWASGDCPGRLVFGTTADGTAVPIERMRIDSSGNVGIGTASPSIVNPYASVVDIRGTTTDQNYGGSIRLASNNGTTTNSYITVSTNGLFIYNTLAHPITFGTNNTERMRIDSSGNVLVGKASATANGGDVQVSKGITFPATQVAASDVNTLDDYEEGTWTPVLAGSTTPGTQTYTWQKGTYTKIGNRVFGQCEIIINVKDAATAGSLRITGLPFASNSNGGIPQGCCAVGSSLTLTALYYYISGTVENGASYINLRQHGSAALLTVPDTNFANGTQIVVSFNYYV
jgi:hypothetical protein